jgi:hypothetical protein
VADGRARTVRREHEDDGIAAGDELAETRFPLLALADRLLVDFNRVALVVKAEAQLVREGLVDAGI